MMADTGSEARCFGISQDMYPAVYAVCNALYFLNIPLFGTLFPYDLIAVELSSAASELKEEQYCYSLWM